MPPEWRLSGKLSVIAAPAVRRLASATREYALPTTETLFTALGAGGALLFAVRRSSLPPGHRTSQWRESFQERIDRIEHVVPARSGICCDRSKE